jgi:hypothetical protein
VGDSQRSIFADEPQASLTNQQSLGEALSRKGYARVRQKIRAVAIQKQTTASGPLAKGRLTFLNAGAAVTFANRCIPLRAIRPLLKMGTYCQSWS